MSHYDGPEFNNLLKKVLSAAKNGDVKTLRKFNTDGTLGLVGDTGELFYEPLAVAAEYGQMAVVKFFVEESDIMESLCWEDHDYFTDLSEAIRRAEKNGKIEIVHYLRRMQKH